MGMKIKNAGQIKQGEVYVTTPGSKTPTEEREKFQKVETLELFFSGLITSFIKEIWRKRRERIPLMKADRKIIAFLNWEDYEDLERRKQHAQTTRVSPTRQSSRRG